MRPYVSVATKVAVVALVQLALVGVAVAPRLSARMTGDEYRLRVAPVDPIDPFRGAYVALDYPDIRSDAEDDGEDLGPLYVSLVPDGDVWVASGYLRERPAEGPYLACDDRDWSTKCGIESLFLPQDEAAAMEEDVAGGSMVAVVKVDSRGHAALVRVEKA
jgi:uncharacterized membrane-anchored protein